MFRLRFLRRHWQTNSKAGPLPGLTVKENAPIVTLDDALRNRKPQTGPAYPCGHKRVEDPFPVLGRDDRIGQCAPQTDDRVIAGQILTGVVPDLNDRRTGDAVLDTRQLPLERLHVPRGVDEPKQQRYYAELTDWARENASTVFLFEACDEPWKGTGTEGHWGLFTVER